MFLRKSSRRLTLCSFLGLPCCIAAIVQPILVWSCPGLRVMALAGIILTLAAGSEPVRDNEYGRRVVAQTLEDDYEALVWKVIRESQRSIYIALRVGFSDPGYTVLETKLSVVGTVRRVAAADFEARVTNDENLKRRRTAQLTSLQAGSLGFVEQALALAATGGNPRSQRLAAQRALAVADRISSAQSSGVKVKAMEEESTVRRGD